MIRIKNKLKEVERQINIYKDVFDNCKTVEDMIDVKTTISELEADKISCYHTLGKLSFIDDMLFECDKDDHMYWTIS